MCSEPSGFKVDQIDGECSACEEPTVNGLAFDCCAYSPCVCIECGSMCQWLDIKTAPKDGRSALVYRPLAHKSNDPNIAIKRLIKDNNHCWDSTVPEGQAPTNPTDGACHVTHWMDLPSPPKDQENE